MTSPGVSCPICLDNFDDPRILPCGHSYCSKCLKGIVGSRGGSIVQCPKRCVMNPPLYQRNIDQLPVNYDLKASLEELKTVQQKAEEEQCDRHKMPMQGFCSTCSSLVCFGCVISPGNHHAHYHECKPIEQCTQQLNKSITMEEEQAQRLSFQIGQEILNMDSEIERLTKMRNNLRNGVDRIKRYGKVVKSARTVTQKWLKSQALKKVRREVLEETGFSTLRPAPSKREEALDLRKNVHYISAKPRIHAVPIDELLCTIPPLC